MKRRILSMLLVIVMVLGLVPGVSLTASAAETSGTTGDVTWSFDDSTGTLTVSGEGAMAYHTSGSQPWYAYKDSITTVIVEKGVTSISTSAFQAFPALKTVKIAGSVTAIGNNAFYDCSALTTIEYYGSSAPQASSTAFFGCSVVANVLTTYEGSVFCGKNISKNLDAANEPVPAAPAAPEAPNGTNVSARAIFLFACYTELPSQQTHQPIGIPFDIGYFEAGEPVKYEDGKWIAEVTGEVKKMWEEQTSHLYAEIYPGYAHTSENLPENLEVTLTWNSEAKEWVYEGDRPTYDIFCAPLTYTVTVDTPTNGTVTADKNTVAAGDTVTLTVTPKSGYEIDTVMYNGTVITANDGVYAFTMPASDVTVTATFKPATFSVNVLAVDTVYNQPLAGAHLQILNANGVVVRIDGEQAVWTSTTEAHTVTGLKTGVEYTLRAEVAPEGYVIPYDITFTIDQNGNITFSDDTVTNGTIQIEFEPTAVRISAIDSADGDALAGATLQILYKDGVTEKVAAEWESTPEAHTVTGLKTGVEYTLRAKAAPEGYTIADDFTFYIDQNGNVTSTGSVDEGVILVKFAQVMVKVSAIESGAKEAIEGAYLQILDAEGKPVDAWVSTVNDEDTQAVDESIHEVKGLKTGVEYTLRTVIAPDGYAIADDTTFSIGADGEVTTTGIKNDDGVLLVEFDLTVVGISAVDDSNGSAIADATVQILDASGNVVEEWFSAVDNETTEDVDESVHAVTGLTAGKEYTLHAKVAPEGYTVPADSTFSIDEKGKVTTDGSMTEEGVILVKFVSDPDPVNVTLELTKAFNDWSKADSFTFKLAAAGDAPMPASTSAAVSKDTPVASFSPITFTKTGTYTYTITEVDSGILGVTYDTSEHKVVVTVTEDAENNKLTADVTYDGKASLIITNTYKAPTYTVTFVDADGKTIGEPQIVEHGKAATAPEAPAKTGYTFDGWEPAFDNVTSNLTVTAKWKINQYSIIFDTDGGTAVEPITQDYGTEIFKVISTPTKTGYTFAGWDTEIPATMPAEDVTIKAQWTINKHDIVYKVDGVEYDRIEDVTYGTAITPIAEPTKTGHTFSGWSTIPATMPDEEVVINGTFTVKSYLIDWMVKGYNEDGSDAGYRQTSVNYGDPITAPDMRWDKKGYLFSGWLNVPATMPAENIVIYGEWIKNFGTITWTVDGETYAATTATYGNPITLPDTAPEKTGYTFKGWKDVPAVMPQTDLTIAAEFTANTYQINWYANGGYIFYSGNERTVTNQTFGQVIVPPQYNILRTGYTFTGWNTKADGSGDTLEATTVMDKASNTEVLYYAQWDANEYTITFNTDGGTAIDPIKQDYNTDVTAPAAPTKTGYTFAGWDKEIPAYMPAKNMTVTAQWTVNQYTITFDTDGGSVIDPIKQDYNTAVTAPAAPTKTGYTFAGWDKEIPATMPAEDVTITAKWTINQYTITFNTDGGSVIDPITQDYNTDVTAPAAPTKTGYTFAGWDTEIPATMPAGDITIKAQWEKTVFEAEIEQPKGGEVKTDRENPTMGDEVIITVTPDEGKIVDEITVTDEQGNDVAVFPNSDGTFSYIQPAGNVTIQVAFRYAEPEFDYNQWYQAIMSLYNQTFSIRASASGGGSITNEGTARVKYDRSITYTITPDEGYAIAAVLVDGRNVGAVSEYTFRRVRESHTIEAVFAKSGWQNPFRDVSKRDWFYEDVQFVSENGLMNGVSEDRFSPDGALTRAMLVTVLWRLEGEPVVDYIMPFTDIPADEWYTEAVRWAAAEGIVNGYEDGTFGSDGEITREQTMAILHRYAAYKGLDNGAVFPMIPQCDYSPWAENDIIWADMVGLTDGIGKDIFDMTKSADRGEIAAYLRRFCEAFEIFMEE